MEPNATHYEVINKETGVISSVSNYEAGQGTVVVHLADGTPIIFNNQHDDGNLLNETYTIREVGTHSQPDGTGTVNDAGVPTE